MTLPIIFHEDARTEYDEAHDWYEAKQAGLGDRLTDEVEAILNGIVAMPKMHPCIRKDVHRAVLPTFPYSVLYRVTVDSIRVISVFHGNRNPKKWHRRS